MQHEALQAQKAFRLTSYFAQAKDSKAWFQLGLSFGLYCLTWGLMAYSFVADWPYLITLALAPLATGFLTRLFIFQHDCGHGSFFRKRKVNNFVGRLIGVLTLVPYDYWKRTHSIHHSNAGNLDRRGLGEIDTLTVEEYLSLSNFDQLKYRIYRNIFFLLTVGAFWTFVVKHRWPKVIQKAGWEKARRNVVWTNVGILLLAGGGTLILGWETVLFVQAPISLLSGMLGIWLFYVQHQFERTYWQNEGSWDKEVAAVEGSSFYDLPGWLHWLTGNIGYHHIHHLNPKVPNYLLPGCSTLLGRLEGVNKLTLRESLACSKLALWSPFHGRMCSFDDPLLELYREQRQA